VKIFIAVFVSFFLLSCGGGVDFAKAESDVDLKVFFSKTSGSYYDGGVDNIIVDDINSAKESIYMAMYDLTNSIITDALIAAKDRGVEVKVTTDSDTIIEDKYQELIDAGVEVTQDDNSNALMHDKFLIIDKKILWSGSGNYTVYSFYRNYENYVRVNSQDVAKAYYKEFELLKNRDNSSYRSASFDNLNIYFSPDSDFDNKIIELIDGASTSVYFLAFSFTNKDIADALIRAKSRGVDIKGVFDESQNSYQTYSKYDYLLDNNIDVKLDGNSYKLHSKVMLIDNNITITGSYNFTNKANDYNNENSLVIISSEISAKYHRNFIDIYNLAQ